MWWTAGALDVDAALGTGDDDRLAADEAVVRFPRRFHTLRFRGFLGDLKTPGHGVRSDRREARPGSGREDGRGSREGSRTSHAQAGRGTAFPARSRRDGRTGPDGEGAGPVQRRESYCRSHRANLATRDLYDPEGCAQARAGRCRMWPINRRQSAISFEVIDGGETWARRDNLAHGK